MIEYITGIILLIIITYIIYLYILSIYNSYKFGVPQVSSFNSDFKAMKKGLKKYDLENKKIVDLGSGTGKVLRFFEKYYNTKSYGYEIDKANVIISKLINNILGYNAKTIKKSYLKTNLYYYDYVYVYLFPHLINDIEYKVQQECRNGTIVFSNAFKFNKLKPIDIIYGKNNKEEVYIYEIKKQD